MWLQWYCNLCVICCIVSTCSTYSTSLVEHAVYLNSSQYGPLVVDQTSWFELYFAGEIQKFSLALETVKESSCHLTDACVKRRYVPLSMHCTIYYYSIPFLVVTSSSVVVKCK